MPTATSRLCKSGSTISSSSSWQTVDLCMPPRFSPWCQASADRGDPRFVVAVRKGNDAGSGNHRVPGSRPRAQDRLIQQATEADLKRCSATVLQIEHHFAPETVLLTLRESQKSERLFMRGPFPLAAALAIGVSTAAYADGLPERYREPVPAVQ